MPATADIDSGTSVQPLLSSARIGVVDSGLAQNTQLPYQFIDYRTSSLAENTDAMPPILKEFVCGLTTPRILPGNSTSANRYLPTVLLYDDTGLDYFDRITYLPEYYLTACEIEILRTHIEAIVAEIPNSTDVIELGCGSLRKTELLLDALNRERTGVTYYAIDVMPQPLHESMAKLASRFSNISFCALCGTYDEVLPRLRKSARPKTVLWLGSSIGNLHSPEVVEFLTKISQNVMTANDAILIGMDKQKPTDVIMHAYHDSLGITAKFELNILPHINQLVADYVAQQSGSNSNDAANDLFDMKNFRYVGVYDEKIGRHDSFLEACEDVVVRWPCSIAARVKDICGSDEEVIIKRGERLYVESAYKYSDSAAEVLAQAAGLTFSAKWIASHDYYMLNMFRKPQAAMTHVPQPLPVSFNKWSVSTERSSRLSNNSLTIKASEQFPTIPSIDEWQNIWKVWDLLTLQIITHDKLLMRPIDLRHPFIFYLGHIPAFADIHMAAAETAPLSEPAIFAQWFERGIDPNMEDTSICHTHSEVPDKWPPVEEITVYRDNVRRRIAAWIDSYSVLKGKVPADAARHVWMAFEHEAMHIETLLYIVLQMDPGDIRSPINCTFEPNRFAQPARCWIRYAGCPAVVLGLSSDNEAALGTATLPPGHVFGWDNESPSTNIAVKPFKIQTQPITNGEYFTFLKAVQSGNTELKGSIYDLVPRSWIVLEHDQHSTSAENTTLLATDYGVRTVVGTPSIFSTEAALWPVIVSQVQAVAYANWKGKRLPTESEWTHAARTYHLAYTLSITASESTYSSTVPVDMYLDELLSAQNTTASVHTCQPYDLFVPSDANVGFAHWHPVPVPALQPNSITDANGLPDATFIGNTWEWTSTQFYPFDGFQPSAMYPGYSADFFDPPETCDSNSAHYVIKGGTFATHPRIALRQTFRNWYQRGYPYMLASFRLCEDTV